MIDSDVLVVGGGPVGETLAVLLASYGLTATVLEKSNEVWPKPRAVHFDGETLRTFQSVGLGDAVSERTRPMLNYRMTNEAGDTLLEFPTGQPGDEGWLEDVMFHQPDVDRLLRDAIHESDRVTLLEGWEVVDIEQTDELVTVTAESAGVRRDFTGRYVVGADGASSFVRRWIGSAYEQLGPNDPWLVVDGLFTEEPAITDSMHFFGKHSRPRLWAALPGRRRRMEFKVLPNDDPDEIVTPEWIAQATDGVMRPDNFDIERTAVYTFRSCLADQWRSGRVFLAGDAAHLAPPLFGQGLCSGIRDAANLSWKLALVLGGTDPALLDSYESERKPHARAWVEQATRMSEVIQTTDSQVAAQRDAFVRAHPEAGVAQKPPLGPGLHSGDHGGARALQPQVDGSARYDDIAGQRFLVIATTPCWASTSDAVRDALSASPWVTVRDSGAPGSDELLTTLAAEAVVVRPDRYVYGTASDPTEFHGLIDSLVHLISTAEHTAPAA